MGNSNSTTTTDEKSLSQTISESIEVIPEMLAPQTLSSFGDPIQTAKTHIETWSMQGKIPPLQMLYKYQVYRYNSRMFGGHESIVIVTVNDDNNSNYGSFTLELGFFGTGKQQTFGLQTNYFNAVKSKENITKRIWKRPVFVEVSFSGIPVITFNTWAKNFVDLGIKLISHHGYYSLYSNNCQTFARTYAKLLYNLFVGASRFNNFLTFSNSDGERCAIGVVAVAGNFFGNLLGICCGSSIPAAVPIVSSAVTVTGINYTVNKYNNNEYHKVFNDPPLLTTQKNKIEILQNEYNLSKEKSTNLLWSTCWDLDEAIKKINKDKDKDKDNKKQK